MDLDARLEQAQVAFDKLKEQRDKHLQQATTQQELADNCLNEMTRLQGEHRVLTELIEADKPKVSVKGEKK